MDTGRVMERERERERQKQREIEKLCIIGVWLGMGGGDGVKVVGDWRWWGCAFWGVGGRVWWGGDTHNQHILGIPYKLHNASHLI